MKRIGSCILCLLLAAGMFAETAGLPAGMKGKIERILLQGQLNNPKVKSLTTSQPVEVIQTDLNLRVNFLSSSGSLTVKVTNAQSALVFGQTVNATAGNGLTIDTQGWSAGAYNISITNTTGGRLEGAFAIE